MQLGLDQDSLAGLEVELRAVLPALEQGGRNVVAGRGIPQVGGDGTVHPQAPASGAANDNLERAARRRGQPAGEADGEVVLRQPLGKVAEEAHLARIDVPGRVGLAEGLLATEELHREARPAVEVAHVHAGQGRKEEADLAGRLVDDLDAGERGAEPVEWGDGGRGGDVRRAAALGAGLGRVRPDDRHLADAGRCQRQRPVVGQQHERLGGGSPHQRGGFGIGEVPGLCRIELWAGGGPADPGALLSQRPDSRREQQHPARLVVQDSFAHLAPPDGRRQVGSIEAGRSGHLQVQAGHGPGHRVVGAVPVGDQHAVPGPLALQDLADEVVVVGAVDAVDPVVGGHDRPRPGVRGRLEGDQIDLAQCPFVDPAVDRRSVRLRIVGDVMLGSGRHACRLHPLDVRRAQHSGEHGILREGLEVAAAQRGSDQVEHRPEHVVDAGPLRLESDPGGNLMDQVRVPGRAEGRAAWRAGGARAGREGHPADAVRAVQRQHRLEADRRRAARVPGVDPARQPRSLLDSEPPDELVQAFEGDRSYGGGAVGLLHLVLPGFGT